MNVTLFTGTLTGTEPPPDTSACLKALWHDAKGDWYKAHILIQDLEDKNAAWIHAYLHRKEGTSRMRIIGIAGQAKKSPRFLWKKNGRKL